VNLRSTLITANDFVVSQQLHMESTDEWDRRKTSVAGARLMVYLLSTYVTRTTSVPLLRKVRKSRQDLFVDVLYKWKCFINRTPRNR